MSRERLQKILAAAGVASRRECEQLILDGRVSVNGERARTLPAFADAACDAIVVDGKRLRPERKAYYVLHKPKGVHCTNYDPAGRTRVADLLAGVRERVFPVGRLDADSVGLLILTNDGELAERLAHPRYGVPKTYRAHVNGRVTEGDLERLRKGVWLAEGKAQVAEARVVHRGSNRSVVEITLREGRNREVRRVLARLRHPVRKLIRIRIGPLSLKGLPVGAHRALSAGEVAALRKASAAGGGAPTGGLKRRGGRAPRGRARASGFAASPRRKRATTRGAARPASGPTGRKKRRRR
jgi:23S rRNA pseudouridine2605 synthase